MTSHSFPTIFRGRPIKSRQDSDPAQSACVPPGAGKAQRVVFPRARHQGQVRMGGGCMRCSVGPAWGGTPARKEPAKPGGKGHWSRWRTGAAGAEGKGATWSERPQARGWGETQPVYLWLRPGHGHLPRRCKQAGAGQLGTSFPWGWMGAEARGPHGTGLDCGCADSANPQTGRPQQWMYLHGSLMARCVSLSRGRSPSGDTQLSVCLTEFDQDSVSAEPAQLEPPVQKQWCGAQIISGTSPSSRLGRRTGGLM